MPYDVDPLRDTSMDWRERLFCYERIIIDKAPNRPIKILEIGVFKGSLTEHLAKTIHGRISRYVGVDPYIGDESDPYFRAYWKSDRSIAEETFNDAQALFSSLKFEIVRKTSTAFFEDQHKTFDVIVVDGDHRAEPAFDDLCKSWEILAPGGIVLLDDYANPDHPGVRAAGDRFDREIGQPQNAEAGCRFVFFNKPSAGRRLPYPLGIAYWIKPPAG